jgi:lipid II:glycine glycyltransferase (peptidoglycan interpeptide bridge formation enzyme)
MDAVTEAAGFIDASRWYVTPDGRDLVLPLAQRRFGRRRGMRSSFSEPWGMGGLLSSGGITPADVEMVLEELELQPALRTTIHVNPLLADQWAAARPSVEVITRPRLAHVLDLQAGAETVWNEQMTSKARGGVRRARKLGIETECDTSGRLLPAFYEMLLKSFDRWAAKQREPRWMTRLRGRQRDPLSKFEVLADHLGEAFRLYVARYEGRPVAAIIVLRGTNADNIRSVMDVEAGRNLKATELLHWTAIEDACRVGCLTYHMGESREGSTVARFKEKLGARPVHYSEHIIEHFPVTRIDRALRAAVKRAIGFHDA